MNTLTKVSLAFNGVLVICGVAVGAWFLLQSDFFVQPDPLGEIKKIVRQSLKDPDSAKFSKVTLSRKTGYFCGLVNAKNQMGGYVGDKRFVASLKGEVVFDPERKSPDAPPEQPIRLTMPSTSVYGMGLDAINMANEVRERGRQIEAYIGESRSARAENSAFQQLVNAKCFN